mmetsp:Transcript_18068/g.22122  ORF Transcript_18068/g.22122 Transcript_18068/m.22122 type:complete len:219 (+) Transcript_18068:774-1430(+)
MVNRRTLPVVGLPIIRPSVVTDGTGEGWGTTPLLLHPLNRRIPRSHRTVAIPYLRTCSTSSTWPSNRASEHFNSSWAIPPPRASCRSRPNSTSGTCSFRPSAPVYTTTWGTITPAWDWPSLEIWWRRMPSPTSGCWITRNCTRSGWRCFRSPTFPRILTPPVIWRGVPLWMPRMRENLEEHLDPLGAHTIADTPSLIRSRDMYTIMRQTTKVSTRFYS